MREHSASSESSSLPSLSSLSSLTSLGASSRADDGLKEYVSFFLFGGGEALWMGEILHQWETIVCWYLQGCHASRVSQPVQEFVHPQYGLSFFLTCGLPQLFKFEQHPHNGVPVAVQLLPFLGLWRTPIVPPQKNEEPPSFNGLHSRAPNNAPMESKTENPVFPVV